MTKEVIINHMTANYYLHGRLVGTAEDHFHFVCKCKEEGDFPWVSTGTDRDKKVKALVEFIYSCPKCGRELAKSTTPVDFNR